MDDLKAILGTIAVQPGSRSSLHGELDRHRVADEKWVPSEGPQSQAYDSKADVLLYGGEPGGGKSQLILGLAFNEHRRSLIMRRHYGELERLIEDALSIHGSRHGFTRAPHPRLHFALGRTIHFRAAQHVGDERGTMGHGRDLLGIDEATLFAESQVRFLMGWVRSEVPGQRCRTVLATNPPLTSEGLWVNAMFAPWLDPNFPDPAKSGELRWVITDEEGKDQWVEGPDDVRIVRGKAVRPTSRTFIPASVRDNPYYAATDYERQLDALPEPYRTHLMGGFRTTFRDADFQVIPSVWIAAAQERWRADGARDVAMTAMGYDPAGGGADSAELAFRHGGWYAPLVSAAGKDTADGSAAAGLIISKRRAGAAVVVDVGGGYGGAVTLRLKDNGIPYVGFNGAGTSTAKTKDRQLRFANKRAEAWWKFREALDPDQDGGSAVCLPPDPQLRADLAAPVYEVSGRGILIEGKDELRRRLGRSPGKGDAVVMCFSEGNAAVRRGLNGLAVALPVRANLGYASIKRRILSASTRGA
jgi:hypothetical protein